MRAIVFVVFLAIGSLSIAADIELPGGWRYPSRSDYADDWLEFGKIDSPPFVARADFNGDGVRDEAWLLLKHTGPGWGLFVFLSQKDKPHQVIKIEEHEGAGAQSYGIGVLAPGSHKTACGKGYDECEAGEPKVLVLKRPGLEFFKFESALSVLYWSDQTISFKQIWLSD